MELTTQDRDVKGKKVRTLRDQGLIPAVFYGHGMENKNLSVDRKEFETVFREAGESTIVNLKIGLESRPVVIHDIDRDAISGEVVHIDFYGVRMDEEITVTVPLEFTGIAPAIKEKGGVLNTSLTEVEVTSLPANLPHSLAISLESLTDIGSSIHVKDISLPAGVKIDLDPETAVVTVALPRVEVVEEVPAEMDVSAVKVETEEKKAERTAEKEQEKETSTG